MQSLQALTLTDIVTVEVTGMCTGLSHTGLNGKTVVVLNANACQGRGDSLMTILAAAQPGVLRAVSVLAVIVNCCLVVQVLDQRDDLAPYIDGSTRILAVVAAEHVVLGLKFAIDSAVPETPLWVLRRRVNRIRQQGKIKTG